ncbi:hypothetical protein [Thalassotalea piscium]|uniref:Uncharacterized protein n=1 Tax=Thalassotalea piscium TaxID=1230533 RepID=A0A7X0NGB5_9GAMM|nr:hypothetical protein [Thalassotalea piscium]MBB6542855.1 hypothetical protein [Thalassotalea piscium]
MLHNILLNAGEYTEQGKQGKYINVVLAAGEITARVRLSGGGVMQTQLVSGMAFPVPQGFESVAFFSEVSQQTKIWLGNLPLTYSPMDSKIVGSSALESKTGLSFYNEVTQLLPSSAGRGKVTLSAKNDFFVGGAGMTIANAIKIKANELFEISTQGAINSFVNLPTATKRTKVIVKEPIETAISGIVSNDSSHIYGMAYSNINDVLIYSDSTKTYRVNASDLSSTNVSIGGGLSLIGREVFVENNKYYVVHADGADIKLTSIDLMDLSIVTVTLLSGVGTAGNAWLDNGKVIVQVTYGTPSLYLCDLDGISSTLIDPIGLTGTQERAIICPNGDILVFANDYCVRSADDGVTWESENPTPFPLAPANRFFTDKVTGAIFLADSKKLWRTIDNGDTWLSIKDFADTIYGVYSVSDCLYVTTSNVTHNVFVSYDSGDSFNLLSDAALTGRAFGVLPAENDKLYVAQDNGLISAFYGDSSITGGEKISILSEVN